MRNSIVNRRSAIGTLFLSLLLAALSAQATSPKEITVFGESTSDVGNLYIAVGSPPSSYWTDGRIGDGPNWTDYLASEYKHVVGMVPSLAGGTNYAIGGADTSFGIGPFGLGSTGLQVTEFLSQNPSIKGNGNKLFVFWAGGNDILAGETDMMIPAGNIITQIGMLFDAGARHFLVLNMYPLGLTPDGLAGGGYNALSIPSDELNDLATALNERLLAGLGSFKCSHPAAKFYVLDVNQLYLDVLRNPGLYGFLDITHPVIWVNGDPDTSLWWDGVHTTTRFHALIAQQAVDLLSHHNGGLRCGVDLDD